MNTRQIRDRIQSITRDFDGIIFRVADLNMYINESIDRIKAVIPELRGMKHIIASEEEPIHLPGQYHHLIALYGASRCFSQDERHYQGANLMNEFENKIYSLKTDIESYDEFIYDEQGVPIVIDKPNDYVQNDYFFKRKGRGQF